VLTRFPNEQNVRNTKGEKNEERGRDKNKQNNGKKVKDKAETVITRSKGKSVPLQAWSGPEGSRKLRLPEYVTTAQDGGKVVSLKHRPPLPPRKYSWYSFLLEAESTPGPW